MNVKRYSSAVLSTATVLISLTIALGVGEVAIRVKNSSMKNYDIEMWRYAKELKIKSDVEVLGHEHLPSTCAVLQSVKICTDSHGLRADHIPPIRPSERRILFLGSSVTLGWGVPDSETMTARLQEKFLKAGEDVEIFNAGIGNYNAVRYVTRFEQRLTDLKPTDIVVHYFLRDAEVIDSGGSNTILRNSQLAVTSWIAASRYLWKSSEKSLESHYTDVYEEKALGNIAMRDALRRLAEYSKAHNIRLYLAMTPDVHDLKNYKFTYIHEYIRSVANPLGYKYLDLYDHMKNLTPQQLWAMPGDPHPNSLGHKLMAEAIYPFLQLPTENK